MFSDGSTFIERIEGLEEEVYIFLYPFVLFYGGNFQVFVAFMRRLYKGTMRICALNSSSVGKALLS